MKKDEKTPKAAPAKAPPAKPLPGKAAPAKTEPAKVMPAKTPPAKQEAPKTAPARTPPAKLGKKAPVKEKAASAEADDNSCCE